MTDMTKLQEEADVAGRRLIASSGEPEMIQEMAMWLSFEFEKCDGEGQGAEEHRCVLEAKRRWPKSDHADFTTRTKTQRGGYGAGCCGPGAGDRWSPDTLSRHPRRPSGFPSAKA